MIPNSKSQLQRSCIPSTS